MVSEQSTDSSQSRQRASIVLIGLAAIAVFAVGFAPGIAAAGNDDISYVTDSGFEVVDVSGGDPPSSGNPFPDDNTLDLPGITLEAAGNAGVTLEQRTGTYTNLSSVDDDPAITVTPDDKQKVSLEGNIDRLDFADVDYSTSSSSPDLVYEASSTATLRLESTGISSGETIEATDVNTGTPLDSASVQADGSVTFSNLDAGTHTVNLAMIAPSISNLDASNPAGQDVQITFDSNKQLQTISVSITGAESATLSTGDFAESGNDPYTYGVTYTGSSDGTYDVTLDTAEDSAGNDGAGGESDSVSISTAGGGDDGDEGDSGGPEDGTEGSDGNDDADGVDDGDTSGDETDGSDEGDGTDDENQLQIVEQGENLEFGNRALEVSIHNTSSDATLHIDNTTIPSGGPVGSVANVTIDNVSLRLAQARDTANLTITAYEYNVTTRQVEDPQAQFIVETARSFDAQTRSLSAGYLDIEHDLKAADIDSATIEFSVRNAYLDAIGVDSEDITLYRNSENGTGWEPQPTANTGETETHARFASELSGFSVFAIGTGAEATVLTETELSDDTIELGESVTVSATVVNRGTIDAETELTLAIDGAATTTETVKISGESAETTEFEVDPDETGTYELTVNGDSVGSLTVDEADTSPADDSAATNGEQTDDDADADEGEQPGDDGFPVELLAIVAVLIALLVVIVIYHQRVR